MKRIGLAVVVLVLGLVACSSPDDLVSSPQLSAQFGSAEDDIGLDVAFASTGRIYSLSQEEGPYRNEYGDEDGYYTTAFLRRYDNNGKLVWTREVEKYTCDFSEYSECAELDIKTVETNGQGKVYALYNYSGTTGDCMLYNDTYVDIFDASGNESSYMYLGGTGVGLGESGSYSDAASISVDGSGNVYAAFEKAYIDPGDTCSSSDRAFVVVKRSPNGSLIWQRTSTVGQPTDILISPSGSLYVTGTKGLAKYTTSGSLVWTKAIGPLENVVVSGSSIYVRHYKDIRKFDGNGKQLWLKTQSGLNTLIGQDLSGDTSGNIYLSGKYNVGSGNYNPFVRKINSSGSVLWTKTYGTSSYDDARGIATINGSEIYVTGETQGSLSHTNIGGRDSYLRKLNSSGNLVWSK